MKIEIGKKYKNRNGAVVGPMELAPFPFQDEEGSTYSREGDFSEDGVKGEYDLIEEYTEPKQVETWGVIDTGAFVVVATFQYLSHASTFATTMSQLGGSYKPIKLVGEL